MHKSGLFALSAVCCLLLTACGDSSLDYYKENGCSDIQLILESIKIK